LLEGSLVKTVAVIGGGFSGTAAAVNLVRLAKNPLRICLINHEYPLGRGVAYSTRRPEHLLNVAARNMSALAEHPNHLVDWLKTRCDFAGVSENVLREQFIPRRIYGDYLEDLLFWHRLGGEYPSRIDLVAGEALDVVPGSDRAAVVIKGQATVEADMVLLATGNPPPADLALPQGHFEHPRYLSNPWQGWENRLRESPGNVILLGAGLTMIDVFLTLSSLRWPGKIDAVSRTGLMPLAHFRGIDYPDFPPGDPTGLGLDALVALMEQHCGRLRARGENPAIVVDRLRPFTQRVWQKWTREEKLRFCRDYRTRWNVTRHRIAPSIHEHLTEALAGGQLRLVKGKVLGLSGNADSIQVTVQTGADGQRTVLEGNWLINCTGPQESFQTSKAVLFENLFARGLVQSDELDMGIKAGPDFAVSHEGGRPSTFLFAIGPLLKGSLWETTAVPELRIQAHRVAEAILARLEDRIPSAEWAEMYVDVIEYSI
jgi:uncharacterized NAD(P)/FAD-binding protein YdhS